MAGLSTLWRCTTLPQPRKKYFPAITGLVLKILFHAHHQQVSAFPCSIILPVVFKAL